LNPVTSPLVALLAAALVVAGCGHPEPPPAEPRGAIAITSTTVQQQNWPQTLDAHGAVAAWQEAQVSARVSGLPLLSLYVQVGDRVRRGQVLARFDDRTVRADVAAAEATLASARATLRQHVADRNRTFQLRGSGAVSEQELQSAQTQVDTAAAQVDLAAAQLEAQRVRLADCEVRAVDDGVISARSATLGQVAQAGTELFRLIRQDRLEWRAELTAEQMERVTIGQEAIVQLSEGRSVTGRVRQLTPALDEGTRLGWVYVDLPVGSALRAGAYVSGRIALARELAMAVPPEAVVIRDGRASVFRVVAGRAVQVPVATGRRSDGAVEIVRGIRVGERVAMRGAGFLNDGDRVQDTPEAAP